jgi:hypothetical protein
MILAVLGLPLAVAAQTPPLLPENRVSALAQELSGETAKRNLEGLARNHRQRGSRGFHAAAELVAEHARAYQLTGVAHGADGAGVLIMGGDASQEIRRQTRATAIQ